MRRLEAVFGAQAETDLLQIYRRPTMRAAIRP
jgi:hypothetical protein